MASCTALNKASLAGLHLSSANVTQLNVSASFSLRFCIELIVGVGVVSMASSKKDLGLLAGSFLFGLGLLEMAIRVFAR